MVHKVGNKLNQLDLNDKELAKYYEIERNILKIKEDTPTEVKIDIGFKLFDFTSTPKEKFIEVLTKAKNNKDIKRAFKYQLKLNGIEKWIWEDYWFNKPVIFVYEQMHSIEKDIIKYYEELSKKIKNSKWEFKKDEEKSEIQQTFWYYIYFGLNTYKDYDQLTLRVDYSTNQIELVPYKEYCEKHTDAPFVTEEEVSKCCEIPIIKLTDVDWQKIDFNKDIKPHIDNFFKGLI